MSQLGDLVKLGAAHAYAQLMKNGAPSLLGFYHLVPPPGGEDVLIALAGGSKEEVVARVKAKSREIGAVAAMVVTEAWMVKSPKGLSEAEGEAWARNNTRASESPDRIEIVQITATDGRRAVGLMLQIIRDKPGGKIIMLEPLPGSMGADMTGRMIDGIIVPETQKTP